MSEAFHEFRPDIVVTTAQNRYLHQLCDNASIPLLSSEYGPLPRVPYPLNRFLSLDGHLSDGPFHSVKTLRRALKPHAGEERSGSHLAAFLERYHAATSAHSQYDACRDFIERNTHGESVAMLALQPQDWLSWEGALTHAQGPAPIILRALDIMTADKLIVTHHPTPHDHVVGDQFTEIWLSNPALARLPASLISNTSEMFLPFVDEVITVSSNVAMSAFLLGKKIKSLGKSYVRTLEELSADRDVALDMREDIARYLQEDYCISNETFQSAPALQAVILEKVDKKFGPRKLPDASRSGVDHTTVHPKDSIEHIHDKIKSYLRAVDRATKADLLKMFGRHAIGYLTRQDSVGIELGVASGVFSDSLLMSGHFSTLYSVDVWGDHHDDNEFRAASDLLSKHGERSIVLRKTFDEALDLIPDGHLDFMYIDAYAHTGVAAQILETWLPKLKDDAVVAGHDFCRINWPVNYVRLTETLKSLNFKETILVPGVFTSKTDDIFPSFISSKHEIRLSIMPV